MIAYIVICNGRFSRDAFKELKQAQHFCEGLGAKKKDNGDGKLYYDGCSKFYQILEIFIKEEQTEEKQFTIGFLEALSSEIIERQKYDSIWLNENLQDEIHTDVAYACDGISCFLEEMKRRFF